MATTKEDYFSKLLKKYLPKFRKAIELEIKIGNNLAINQAKRAGKKTGANALTLNKKDLDNFTDQIEELIKGVNREMSKKINQAVRDNISNRGSNKDLAKNIKSIFDENSSNYFNYKKRFETIARTESTRVLSTSAHNKARQIGAKKKYVQITDDSRTSDISRAMFAKYGGEENAIPFDEEFSVIVRGKKYGGQKTPFHPSERDLILYIF